MKLKATLTLLALAALGTSASAANVVDWGVLGPVADVAYVTYHTDGPIDDVYTFSIGSNSDVDAYAEEFEARSVSMQNAQFTLYAGTYGDPAATMVGSPYSFTNTATETVFAALASGNYYFEVTGTSAMAGSAYDFEASANESGPPSAVPEPTNMALLLAGIGLMGFVARRRSTR